MGIHPRAGQPATPDLLIDPKALEAAYYSTKPDRTDPHQLVSFGTSGHRGTPSNGTFTQMHILAITQAICDYRRTHGIHGPLYLGKDTHALSRAAERTAVEVLGANGVETRMQREDGFTPTPVISRAILAWNREHAQGPQADGIVITPSHNPPADGGFKYNPPHGGPADTDVTRWIQHRANQLLGGEMRRAASAACIRAEDLVTPYVRDLALVIDMEALRGARLNLAADPLGGAAVGYWEPINELYGLTIQVVNRQVDATFGFMTLDHDGQIRMDCSSPYAMARLVGLKDRYDLAFGNDPDADRHGIVTPTAGLMNPNHYLAAAIRYLLAHRPGWPPDAAVGKTLVSSSLIDRVVASLGRRLAEVPVGFKWFSQGLAAGAFCFGGEESAGASFLQRDGRVWTTDKDGILLALLAAEIRATTGKDPAGHYEELTGQFGRPLYRRIDAPATPRQKELLGSLDAQAVGARELAGEPIEAVLTHAPANQAPIGGLKVQARNGWFAARPSGTENIYKIYAESFKDERHLEALIEQAREMVSQAVAR